MASSYFVYLCSIFTRIIHNEYTSTKTIVRLPDSSEAIRKDMGDSDHNLRTTKHVKRNSRALVITSIL